MITLRRETERRHIHSDRHDIWLTFYPQDHPGAFTDDFGVLTDFSEMRFAPGNGTAFQPRAQAETVTYVHRGTLAQKDSTGRSEVIHSGEFQHMTTGRRVHQKEANASQTEWAHVFQVSLHPLEVGLDCASVQKRFTTAQRHNTLCVVASPDGRKGSLHMQQNALIHSAILNPGLHLIHELLPSRSAWLHIVYGEVTLGDLVLATGDGAGLTGEIVVSFTAQLDTEILLVDIGPNTGHSMRSKRGQA